MYNFPTKAEVDPQGEDEVIEADARMEQA